MNGLVVFGTELGFGGSISQLLVLGERFDPWSIPRRVRTLYILK